MSEACLKRVDKHFAEASHVLDYEHAVRFIASGLFVLLAGKCELDVMDRVLVVLATHAEVESYLESSAERDEQYQEVSRGLASC